MRGATQRTDCVVTIYRAKSVIMSDFSPFLVAPWDEHISHAVTKPAEATETSEHPLGASLNRTR